MESYLEIYSRIKYGKIREKILRNLNIYTNSNGTERDSNKPDSNITNNPSELTQFVII